MPKNVDPRSETRVKIDYVEKALEVLNLKGYKIAQFAQKIISLLESICFGIFCVKNFEQSYHGIC